MLSFCTGVLEPPLTYSANYQEFCELVVKHRYYEKLSYINRQIIILKLTVINTQNPSLPTYFSAFYYSLRC